MADVRRIALSATQAARVEELRRDAAHSQSVFEEVCNALALAVVGVEEVARTKVRIDGAALVVEVAD